MSKPRETLSGWAFEEQTDQPSSLRSPQERNLLQFSPFTAALEDGPRSTQGRFRRVMTTVSGSNGPMQLTSVTSRQLSQMSSSDSGEGAGPAVPGNHNQAMFSFGGGRRQQGLHNEVSDNTAASPEAAGDQNGQGNGRSSTIKVDLEMLLGNRASPGFGRAREVLNGKQASGVEPSQVSSQSKLDNNSTQSAGVAEGEANGSGNALVRGVTAALTKKMSQDGKMIRKISGLLSRTKSVSRRSSQPDAQLDLDDRTSADDVKVDQGIPVRKRSVLGMLGRKETLSQGKRSFIRSPRIMCRNKSGDHASRTEEEGDDPRSCREMDGVGEDEVSLTEDDLAKRAVQIEKFLNSVANL